MKQTELDIMKKDLLIDPSLKNGLLRVLMNPMEIKAANQLVKDGILCKGKSEKKGSLGLVIYYLPS